MDEKKGSEGEGFEPPAPFPVQWFSRPPPSTTRPSLRIEIRPEFVGIPLGLLKNKPCVTGSVTAARIYRHSTPRPSRKCQCPKTFCRLLLSLAHCPTERSCDAQQERCSFTDGCDLHRVRNRPGRPGSCSGAAARD